MASPSSTILSATLLLVDMHTTQEATTRTMSNLNATPWILDFFFFFVYLIKFIYF